MSAIIYKPPETIKAFIKDYAPSRLFYSWIVGPVGSGKTTGLFFKLAYMAKLQKPSPDGIRRTRAVIVRNTLPQLRDTTLSSWNYWFKHGQAGDWLATQNKFVLRFDDVECEVLFRPLDTADDVARVLSLEVTFAILDEFVQIPREIVDALSARLGRYPSAVDGGATNWGMWGSSNPDTEDNWWFDYLHSGENVRRYVPGAEPVPGKNATYFEQPSGFLDVAENVENLPGGRDYYTNQAQGKPEAWIKQFIEAEWGFSAAGKPVIESFRADLHVAKKPLIFNPGLPLIIGLDPGITGSALVFGQEDHSSRLLVMGELVQSGYGANRLIQERLRPYLRRRFPDAKVVISPDPAAANRAQTDERTVVDVFRRYFDVKVETNNRFPLRLAAIEHYTTRLTPAGPALVIDQDQCPQLVRALKGGWKYVHDTKKGETKPEPEKNQYSHVADSFGYLARYFHRQADREARYTASGQKRFVPPKTWGSSYHVR
jgi:hypothetical protein